MASSMFPHDVRAVASLEYLSSYIFRQGFSETFAQAINSEVNSVAFLSKNPNDFFYDLQAARYQNFQSTQPGDVITIVHAPTLEAASSDRSFGNSRFFWNYEANAGGLSRSEPGFHTSALVGRFDLDDSPQTRDWLRDHGGPIATAALLGGRLGLSTMDQLSVEALVAPGTSQPTTPGDLAP